MFRFPFIRQRGLTDTNMSVQSVQARGFKSGGSGPDHTGIQTKQQPYGARTSLVAVICLNCVAVLNSRFPIFGSLHLHHQLKGGGQRRKQVAINEAAVIDRLQWKALMSGSMHGHQIIAMPVIPRLGVQAVKTVDLLCKCIRSLLQVADPARHLREDLFVGLVMTKCALLGEPR